jgi:hypothetical protein
MRRPIKLVLGSAAILMLITLSACNRSDDSDAETTVVPGITTLDSDNSTAVIGASEIPYPVYPNGMKYRVGGENGLKIVVFETNDPFEEVDKFYNGELNKNGMPRLTAMNDYVRYSKEESDSDPWATHRPGIVIHRFQDDAERQAVGANADATTNIIMSF